MLIKDIQRNKYEGLGKPEPLKNNLSGYWSRRIDSNHRLVYRIEQDSILTAQLRFHYQAHCLNGPGMSWEFCQEKSTKQFHLQHPFVLWIRWNLKRDGSLLPFNFNLPLQILFISLDLNSFLTFIFKGKKRVRVKLIYQ